MSAVKRLTRLATAVAFLVPLASCGSAAPPEVASEAALRVASLNVHYISPGQSRLVWEDRREAVLQVVGEVDADVFAFQEMETFQGRHWAEDNVQLDWLRDNLPGYGFAAQSEPRVFPSTQPIMYRRDRFFVLETGFFFFSPTPDAIYSRPWRARFPAFCSFVRLQDRRDGASFYVYNVHLDAMSGYNRRRSAELLVERIGTRERPQDPVVVIGDFNSPAFARPLQTLRRAGFRRAGGRTWRSTFHFARGLNLMPAIDHILVSEGLGAGRTVVWRSRPDGVYPSDHYPISTQITPCPC